MNTENLRKLKKIIGFTSLLMIFVFIFVLIFITKFGLTFVLIVCSVCIIFWASVGLTILVDSKYEEENRAGNQKKQSLLTETEKQVKVIKDYRLVLKNLLEKGTITAKYIEETNKVILRFELIDDEGKTFSKSLEFDTDRIIYDIEIL